MTIRNVVAVTVVVGSACIALETQLASESQGIAVVNVDNPYVFTARNQPHTFTVSAASPGDSDDIGSILFTNTSTCQNFRIEPTVLPAHICGGSAQSGCPKDFTFAVTYLGTGRESCDVAINWMGSGSATALTGSGTEYLRLSSDVSAPDLTVVPESIDFGQIGVNLMSSPQFVRVTNTGGVGLLINPTALGAVPNVFTIMPVNLLAPHMLAVGASEMFQIQCKPPAVGTFSAGLRVTAGTSISKSSNFNCQGVNSTLLIDPSPVSFEATLVGKAVEHSVTISSPVSTTLLSVSLDSTALSNNVSFRVPVAPNTPIGTATLTLRYAPDAPHISGTLGKLVIKSTSETREVAINGHALVGSIGTNPASVEFGPVCINSTATKDVEVFANAAGTVTLFRPEPLGAPFGFAASTGFPVTLEGNHVGSTTLRIGAMPTTAGEFSTTMQLPTDIPGGQTSPLPIHVTAVPRGVGATPQMVQFGTVARNTSSSGREVTLTNCGAEALTISAVSIIGTNPTAFAIVAPNNPAVTLMPNEHLTFLVIMSAQDISGNKSALLHIEYNSGVTDVPLEGTISAASGAGGKDRETYYGCHVAAGSPSGLLGALGVAGSLALARRRRRA